MNKQRKTSHILNVFQYDADGHVVLPASLTLSIAPGAGDNNSKVPTTSWVRTYVTGLTYATQSYVSTQITNLIDAAPGALDTLNELAAALGDDPNFATTITNSLATKLSLTGGTLTGGLYINPTNTSVVGLDVASNTITFRSDNLEGFKRQLTTTLSSGTLVKMQAAGYGGTYVTDLGFYTSSNSAVNTLPNIYLTGGNNYVGINTVAPEYNLDVTGTGRYTSTLIAASFVKSGGTSAQFLMADGSVSTNPGWLTGITSTQVTTALGYTPYNSTNPSGYISGITSGMVTTALGFTPYNATNPSGYITGINSTMVTNALGYTPYNSTNPNGYITSSSLSSYLPLSGGNLSGNLRLVSISGNDQTVENTYGAYLHLGGWGVGRTDTSAVLVNTAYRADYATDLFDMNISRFTNNSGYITSSSLSGYLPLSGGTVTGVTDFGSDSAGNSGIGIRYGSTSYGRIRFYQNGSNHQTIHSFGNDGYSPSNGKINIDGQNGANIGSWNDPDFVVNKGGQTYARGYRGIGNVAGTGEATYHPAGVYSTGTNWLYGTMYMNNNSIRDVMEVYNNGWFRTTGNQGLYNPTNGAHFYPNDLSYGSWRITGSKNGWTGLHFGGGNGITLMMNEGEFGFHREGVGWVARFTSGRFYGTADYAVSAGSATDSSKLPLSGGTINGNLTVYGNYATSGEIYTGYQFKCGSGSDTPYLNNPYGADHWRAAGSAWFTYGPVGSTNFFSTSRRSVKTQIESFSRSALDLINTVAVVEYRYKNDLNNKRIGFIAEDTIEELATQSHDQMDLNSSIGLLIKAVQELSLENKELRNELTLLKTT